MPEKLIPVTSTLVFTEPLWAEIILKNEDGDVLFRLPASQVIHPGYTFSFEYPKKGLEVSFA